MKTINKQRKNLILRALNDKNYIARTINGIAKETHLSREEVITEINLDTDLGNMLKVYPRMSKSGDLLITTKERFYKEAKLTDKFIDIFSSSKGKLAK
jgi:hypothetical protein